MGTTILLQYLKEEDATLQDLLNSSWKAKNPADLGESVDLIIPSQEDDPGR
jgi:hypothetical protein